MASLYALKPRFQQLLRPIANALVRAGLTANQVTVFTALASIAVGLAGRFEIYPPFLFLRMALNAIDGLMAREHNQQSALGGYLNELGDLFADAALSLPFLFLNPWAVAIFIFLSAVSELAAVLAPGPRRNDGPLGKSDRALVLGAMAACLSVGWRIPAWFPWLLVALLGVTIVNRVRRGLHP